MNRLANALLFAICALADAVVQAQVSLEPKFVPGRVDTIEETTFTNQTLKINGMDLVTSGENRSTLIVEAKPATDGLIPILIKTEKLAINASNKNQGINFQFDSANPAAASVDFPGGDALLAALRAVSGMTLTYQLNSQGEVARIDGLTELFQQAPANAVDFLKQRLDEQQLKQEFAQNTAVLPKSPVSVGEKWTRAEVLTVDKANSLTFDRTYEYVGTEDLGGRTLHRIKVEDTKVSYALGPNPLNLTLKESELKIDKSSGAMLFDPEKGAIVSRMLETKILGKIVFQINGNDLPAELDLMLTRTTSMK